MIEEKKVNKILEIFKSKDLMQKRRDFIKKYKIPEDLIYPNFNYYLGEYVRGNTDFGECVDSIFYSDFPYDNFYLKKDIILDYLEIHLLPIKDLLEDKTEDLLEIANKYFSNGGDILSEDNNVERESFVIDEHEIGAKNISEELSDGEFDPFADPSYIADEVINVLDLKFKGEQKRDLFYDNIIKYIKNIRNKFQTFNILTREEQSGGLAMDKVLADKVLNIAESVKKDKENFLLSKQVEQQRISMDKVASIAKTEPKEVELKNLKDLYDDTFVNSNKNKEFNYKVLDKSIDEMYLNQLENKDNTIHESLELENKVDYSGTKLVGPIEELALFTIKDLRTSGSDIKSRINIIERNIKILETYSIKKKILGIKAWLNSEVCNVYKEMINESVQYGSIKKVINYRKEKDLPYLTEDEIEGIFELNNRLRM